MRSLRKLMSYCRWVSLVCLLAAVFSLLMGYTVLAGPLVVGLFASLAMYFMSRPLLKSFTFTIWVFAFVSASMFYPRAFMTWAGFDLGILIVPLIQIIMFGMGTTLSASDFGRVFKMPWPVIVGFVLQFSVMPLTGLVLAKAFGFRAEVAAGVVLIGSCPGGVASNLMTYLAGGNVALSVTMTACSTLASPVMTPFLMDKLAGRYVEIEFLKMMFGIINMIIVPILAGLVANKILYGKSKAFERRVPLVVVGAVSILSAVALILWRGSIVLRLADASLQKDGFIVGLMLIGVVAVSKLIVSVWLKGPEDWMNRALPIVSMGGICYIIAIITARSRDDLIVVGPYLIAAAVIHNFVGYVLGYWSARAARLDDSACRTVAFEVGMQNGGMASGLAMNVLKSAPAALAPAIFGPWMNISGSVLATWWHRRPVRLMKDKRDLKGEADEKRR